MIRLKVLDKFASVLINLCTTFHVLSFNLSHKMQKGFGLKIWLVYNCYHPKLRKET